MTPAPAPSLELSGITKRFGPVPALHDARLHVRSGTVHAVLGENGAGKTTLMRVAFGLTAADHGQVRVGGALVRFRSPADAMRCGIGMVHQHFTIVPAMTVAENVALGGRALGADGAHWRFDAAAAGRRVTEIGERTSLRLDPRARAADLPVSAQQRLEIVKALAHDARLLILDEPTAVLTPAEAGELLRWLRAFADEGAAVVLITHKLPEALSIADEVTVLRQGRSVLSVPVKGATAERLTTAMLGAPIGGTDSGSAVLAGGAARTTESRAASAAADPVVRARGVTLRDARRVTRVHGIDLDIRAGELLGVAGVEGAGQRELLHALARRLAPDGGTLVLPRRVAFIPEDRHRAALILDGTLAENVALRGAGTRRGLMNWARVTERTSALLRAFDVRAPSPRVAAGTLSGGNQQKLVFARELEAAVDLIVAENPTRGLDVRATAAVHARLRAARDSGAAVVFYSSDIDEVLALADRMLVLHAGAAVMLPPDRERVGRAMLGLDATSS